MSTLKMKSMKKILHTVPGVTFVIGLHNSINDETVLKFMIIDNNKQLCYLDDLILTLKKMYANVIIL